MAQAVSALYNLLDRQIKQGESERALTEFVYAGKEIRKAAFICSLECNNQTRPNGPDGNCLFNAAPLTLVGNESYATPLRLKACIIYIID